MPSAAEISVSPSTFTFTTAIGDRDALAERVVALLDIDVELLDIEIIRHLAEHAPRQQFERGVRRLIGIADRLAFLHLVEQARDARIVLVHLDADALEFGEHVGPAGLIGHQNLAPVADRSGATCS